jgi:hypothetical protein
MFYGNCVKMCEDFALNFGDKRTDCCIITTHCLILPFSPGNSWQKATWLSSPTHPTCLTWPHASFHRFPDLTQFDTLKRSRQNRRRCWTPSHDTTSRMHLKMTEMLAMACVCGRALFRGWCWPLGPKLVFDLMAAPVLEIMDMNEMN